MWSSYDQSDKSGSAQSFWDYVPGLENEEILALVGGCVYELTADNRFVCLFAKASRGGRERLLLARLNLQTWTWASGVVELDIPDNSPKFEAVLQPRDEKSDPIKIRFRTANNIIYEGELDRLLSNWSHGQWNPMIPPWSPWFALGAPSTGLNSNAKIAAVCRSTAHIDLFVVAIDQAIWTARWTEGSNWTEWQKISQSIGFASVPHPMATRPICAVAPSATRIELFSVGVVTNGMARLYWNAWDENENGGMWRPDAWSLVEGVTPAYWTVPTAIVDETLPSGDKQVNVLCVSATGQPSTPPQWVAVAHSAWAGDPQSQWDIIGNSGNLDKNEHFVVAAVEKEGDLHAFWWSNQDSRFYSAMRHSTGTWSNGAALSLVPGAPPSPQFHGSYSLAAVSSLANQIHVFGIDKAKNAIFCSVRDDYRDPARWQPWTELEGLAADWQPLSALASGGSIHLAAVDKQSHVHHRHWAPTRNPSWSPWIAIPSLNVSHAGGVSMVSRRRGHLDVFGVGEDGQVHTASWDDLEWSAVAAPTKPGFSYKLNVDGPFDLCPCPMAEALEKRREAVTLAYAKNLGGSETNLSYLDEAYYFVPILLAHALQANNEYMAALDWYRTVYDYSAPPRKRKIAFVLQRETFSPTSFGRAADWLLDPLNPHLIAATRPNAYTRYTKQSIIRCLNEFGDAEFTIDTAESNTKARTLYMTAEALLEQPELQQLKSDCERWKVELGESPLTELFKRELYKKIEKLPSLEHRNQAVESAIRQLAREGASTQDLVAVNGSIDELQARAGVRPTMAERREATAAIEPRLNRGFLSEPQVNIFSDEAMSAAAREVRRTISAAMKISAPVLETRRVELPRLRKSNEALKQTSAGDVLAWISERSSVQRPGTPGPGIDPRSFNERKEKMPVPMPEGRVPDALGGWTPGPSYFFCIPPNPVLKALRRHVEVNLYKLRHCMNIAGMHRDLEPYSAPTDVEAGLPTVGAAGQLDLSGIRAFRPTSYRYATLISARNSSRNWPRRWSRRCSAPWKRRMLSVIRR